MENSSKHKMVWKNTQNLPKSALFVEDSDSDSDDDLWLPCHNKKSKSNFQRNEEVGEELKKDGILLAEKGYFKEALTKWNGSILHKPNDFTLHEMQAQVLMMLDKDMASVQAAERSVALNKCWHTGWQTLGRAQLNIQDPTMAVKSFSRALHLCPSECEVRDELLSTLILTQKMMEPLRELEPLHELDPGEDSEKYHISILTKFGRKLDYLFIYNICANQDGVRRILDAVNKNLGGEDAANRSRALAGIDDVISALTEDITNDEDRNLVGR